MLLTGCRSCMFTRHCVKRGSATCQVSVEAREAEGKQERSQCCLDIKYWQIRICIDSSELPRANEAISQVQHCELELSPSSARAMIHRPGIAGRVVVDSPAGGRKMAGSQNL